VSSSFGLSLLTTSSDKPKLEDTTNPATHGNWRLEVQSKRLLMMGTRVPETYRAE
jgi:hypothetical protein